MCDLAQEGNDYDETQPDISEDDENFTQGPAHITTGHATDNVCGWRVSLHTNLLRSDRSCDVSRPCTYDDKYFSPLTSDPVPLFYLLRCACSCWNRYVVPTRTSAAWVHQSNAKKRRQDRSLS
jgi:hypothetical protein